MVDNMMAQDRKLLSVKLVVLTIAIGIAGVTAWYLFARSPQPVSETRYYRTINPVEGRLEDEIPQPKEGTEDWSYAYYEGTYDSEGRLTLVRKYLKGELTSELIVEYDEEGTMQSHWVNEASNG